MGRGAILRNGRREKHMSQQQFADAAGVSVGTIGRLELDDTAWLSLRPETEEKILTLLEGTDRWGLEHLRNYKKDKKEDVNPKVDIDTSKAVPIGMITQEMVEQVTEKQTVEKGKKIHTDNGLNGHDRKTLSLIEFAYEGLTEASTHEEFVANLNMIKRIINKY